MRSGTSLAAALAIVAIATTAAAEPLTKSDYKLRVAVDVASRYFNTSFSLGKYY